MTVPISLSNVTSLRNETTALTTINNNTAAIQTAFGSALDTAGDTMNGVLDMNSNPIINLPAPSTMDQPVRLQELDTLVNGGTLNITVPSPYTSAPANVSTTTNSPGSSPLYARGDHVHELTVSTPSHGDNTTAIATTAYVQAERLNPSGPLEFGNAVNTMVQTAAAGVGGNNSNSENIAFYDADGGLFIGPGNRTDVTIYSASAQNLFIAHEHIRFKRPATSATRPSSATLWTPIGGGTATVTNTTSYSGLCTLQTNTGAVGDGGTLSQDYNAVTLSGTKMLILLELLQTANQVVEYGLMYDVNNRVYMSRSDINSDGGWVAHCVASGVATSQSLPSSLNTGTTRSCLAIDMADTVNVKFWSSNFNTTIIQGASINTNIPSSTLIYTPYLKITSQVNNVNCQAYITDWYTITNA